MTTTQQFRISAFKNFDRTDADGHRVYETPGHATISAQFDTVEQAQEVAALFPKSAKVTAHRSTGADNIVRGGLGGSVVLHANGVNGGVNETGIKRFRTWLKTAESLGTVAWGPPFATTNAYETLAEFLEAIQ